MAAAKLGAWTFIISSVFFLPSLGCLGNAPQLKPHLYAGDSATDAIVRKQTHEIIRCNSPQMDEMVCMNYQDLECNFQVYVLGCEKWKTSAYENANKCNAAQPFWLKGK